MNKICIIYFSGTNNTKIICEAIKNELSANNKSVKMIKAETIVYDKTVFNPNDFDMIGFAHPVYGSGAPSIMFKLVKTIPDVKNKLSFFVKTAGGYAGINFAASKQLIKKLKTKGYNIFYDCLLAMPSNWLIEFDKSFSALLYKTALKKIKYIADDIIKKKEKSFKTGFILNNFMFLLNFIEDHFGARIFGKFLYVKENCTKCMKCLNNCPANNIVLKNNIINFKWDCCWCMKCIYACPVNSIKNRIFNFVILKNGYNINEIVKYSEQKDTEYKITKQNRYKLFYDYIYIEQMY